MVKNSVCESILWTRCGLGRKELIALIEYLTHEGIVAIPMISKDTGIPEMAVLVCANRLQSKHLLYFATPVPLDVSNDHSCYYRVTNKLRKNLEHIVKEV